MPLVIDPPEYHLRVGQQRFSFLPTVKISEATASLVDYALAIGRTPLVVTRRGKPVAALVPIAEADVKGFDLSTESDFLELIERSRRRLLDEKNASAEAKQPSSPGKISRPKPLKPATKVR